MKQPKAEPTGSRLAIEEHERTLRRLRVLRDNLHMSTVFLRAAVQAGSWAQDNESRMGIPDDERQPISLIASEDLDGQLEEVLAQIADICAGMNELTAAMVSKDDPSVSDRPSFVLGAVDVFEASLPILRGTLDRFRTVPLSGPLNEIVVLHLISIPSLSDHLVLERHAHWGLHYHYCDRDGRRSDTVLCFRAAVISPPTPLLWELHAERNSKFRARPGNWRVPKRRSIYDTCVKDLTKRAANQFRPPSKEAQPVWPV